MITPQHKLTSLTTPQNKLNPTNLNSSNLINPTPHKRKQTSVDITNIYKDIFSPNSGKALNPLKFCNEFLKSKSRRHLKIATSSDNLM